jgi:hypothetical protein
MLPVQALDANQSINEPAQIDGDLPQYVYSRLVDGSPSVCSNLSDQVERKQVFCNISLNDNESDQKLPTDPIDKKLSQANKNVIVKINCLNQNHPDELERPCVPTTNPSLNLSNTESTHMAEFGRLELHASQTLQEETKDVPYEHVKYASLITVLFFWCFPCTGIPALVYARLMKNAYNVRNTLKVREYLKKTENLILATFFFGLTMIAIMFAVLQSIYPESHQRSTINETNAYSFMVRH